jgi:MOSC domain-containing protein YiiM
MAALRARARVSGVVESIHLAPGAAAKPQSVQEVHALAGQGLEGDRYFSKTGTHSKKQGNGREVTLIEAEALDALARDYEVALAPGASRRNIVTRGIALNHLVGKEFRVGEARLRGVRLCEPCGHMERLSGAKGAQEGLVHRGGLRCDIVAGGLIRVGDAVEA